MFSVGPLDLLAAGLLALRRYGLGPTMLGALGLAVAVQPLLPPVPCSDVQPLFRRCQPAEARFEGAMRSDLRLLAAQQQTHFTDHYTFTADPERLGFVLSPGVTVRIVADRDGWAARATHYALPDTEGCAIRWGDVSDGGLGPAAGSAPNEIVCSM